MSPRKQIPPPKDAPPITAVTLREMADRIYGIESTIDSQQSNTTATSKGLGATVQNLSGTVADLESRYATVSNGTFSVGTGAIPADSTFREYGAVMSVQIKSPGPHKQVVVWFGASEISMDSKTVGSALIGEVSFKFSTQPTYGSYIARIYLTGDTRMGIPVMSQRAFNLAEGTFTITAVTRAWNATGSDPTNSVTFNQPYLRAEVVGEG
jgi:hypothetical protein